MTRIMWDGVTANNLPTNAQIVAGYVEGRYTWSQADWNRFPNSIKVTIAIWSSDADVLDIETGDATPAMGPDWVRRQRARGAFPTVYCNRSTWPAVQSALAGAGFVNGQHYDLWLADYTQVPHCPAYAAACQYADPGPYDLSLCQDYWPRGKGATDTMAVLSDAQASTLLAQVQDIHGGVGAMVSFGGPSLPLIFQLLNQLNDLQTKVQNPPAVDVETLAGRIVAKLPTGTATLDAASATTLARAVVDEIGTRVRPA